MSLVSELQKALAPETLIALTDDNRDGQPDTPVIEAIAAAREQEVRQAVAGTVTLNEGTLPPLLADLVLTLTVEALFARRREALPGDWSDRAKRARLLLREIAGGLRPLEGATRPPSIRTTQDTGQRQTQPANLDLL